MHSTTSAVSLWVQIELSIRQLPPLLRFFTASHFCAGNGGVWRS